MTRTFIAHSSQDKPFVRRLAGDLERLGVRCWYDEADFRPGTDLDELLDEVSRSSALILCLSAASARSVWVMREVQHAAFLGIPVLPVLLETLGPELASAFMPAGHVDCRRRQDYRRATTLLADQLRTPPRATRYLSAKAAVDAVRRQESPRGDLIGVSQQGVALFVTLANARDWEFADAPDGQSRQWIVEFFDVGRNTLFVYAVNDGIVSRLPEYLVQWAWSSLPEHGRVTLSAVISAPTEGVDEAPFPMIEVTDLSEAGKAADAAAPDQDVNGQARLVERWVKAVPLPLLQPFIDSDQAVEIAYRSSFPAGHGLAEDLLTLTCLKRDPEHGHAASWMVSFFEPSAPRPFRTVTLEAAGSQVLGIGTGGEMVNSSHISFSHREATWDIVLGAAANIDTATTRVQELRSIQLVDVHGEAQQVLETLHGGEWELVAVSQTGAFESTLRMPAPDVLARPTGSAGQWVLEYLSHDNEPVVHEGRSGVLRRYALCVADHHAATLQIPREIHRRGFGNDLVFRRKDEALIRSLEAAWPRALAQTSNPFDLMSCVSWHPRGSRWIFRFYADDDVAEEIAIDMLSLQRVAPNW
jgi:hypothetical protein